MSDSRELQRLRRDVEYLHGEMEGLREMAREWAERAIERSATLERIRSLCNNRLGADSIDGGILATAILAELD